MLRSMYIAVWLALSVCTLGFAAMVDEARPPGIEAPDVAPMPAYTPESGELASVMPERRPTYIRTDQTVPSAESVALRGDPLAVPWRS